MSDVFGRVMLRKIASKSLELNPLDLEGIVKILQIPSKSRNKIDLARMSEYFKDHEFFKNVARDNSYETTNLMYRCMLV